MFGGGDLDPRQMKRMMSQMGIDMDQLGMDMADLDAEEVIIRTPEEELYFDAPQVSVIEAQGTATYQVVGEPETREREAAAPAVDEDDVAIVAERADVDEATAREALEEADGDLAAAIAALQ
ncbi:MAG: nascent polypeptide-associated complex protein [Halobacteriales archaeon]